MRFDTTLILLGGLISSVIADFHIGKTDFTQHSTNPDKPPFNEWTDYVACPSNYYQCRCYGQVAPDRGVRLVSGATSGDFSLAAGLCGMGRLDFYYRPNLDRWEFYVNKGDGTLQGTCYKNNPKSESCGGLLSNLQGIYHDTMVCYSYICNHA